MNRRPVLSSAVLAVGLAIALLALFTRDSDRDTQSQLPPTATVQPEVAVGNVVQRFVDALATNDGDALYALQEDGYKQACDRDSFQRLVVARLPSLPLEGPASITVRGDTATASLFEVQADGSKERAVISLVMAGNGSWRLAAPSTTGCTPAAP
jgi:hypothetical protein